MEHPLKDQTRKSTETTNIFQVNHPKRQSCEKLDAHCKKIIEIVEKNGYVTNNMVQEELSVSHTTAHKLLTQLVHKGILERKGKSRNIRSKLSDL